MDESRPELAGNGEEGCLPIVLIPSLFCLLSRLVRASAARLGFWGRRTRIMAIFRFNILETEF